MQFLFASSPHPRPLPKKGGEWCSTQLKTLIFMFSPDPHPDPLPLVGKGVGGKGC